MEEQPWAVQLRDLLGAADQAATALRGVTSLAWENVVAGDCLPRLMPEPLASHLTALERDLSTIRDTAGKLFSRLCSEPSGDFLRGVPLSREEYYICRAMGVDFGGAQELGLTELADYEVYRLLCYEVDQRFSYINVHLAPRDAQLRQVGARFGRPPEECRRRYLRPEQLVFFRDRLPDVYRRFSDD